MSEFHHKFGIIINKTSEVIRYKNKLVTPTCVANFDAIILNNRTNI